MKSLIECKEEFIRSNADCVIDIVGVVVNIACTVKK